MAKAELKAIEELNTKLSNSKLNTKTRTRSHEHNKHDVDHQGIKLVLYHTQHSCQTPKRGGLTLVGCLMAGFYPIQLNA